VISRVSYPEGNVLKVASISIHKPSQSRGHVVHYAAQHLPKKLSNLFLHFAFMLGIFHVGGALKTAFKYRSQEEIADRKIGRSRWSRNSLISGDTHLGHKGLTAFMDIHATWQVS
jgi:hypothetical protein